MSIERGHSTAVQTHRAAHAAHGKTSASAQTADGDAAGGFLALLSALDSVASDAVPGDPDLDKDKDALARAAAASADPALAGAAVPDAATAAHPLSSDAAAAAGALAAAMLASQGSGRAAGEGAAGGGPDVAKIGAGASAKGAGAVPDASSDAQSLAATNSAVTARASEYASVFEQLQNRLAAKSAADETLARLDAAAASNGAAAAAKATAVGAAGESRAERSDRANALMATMALARQGTSSTEALTGKSEVAVQRVNEPAGASSVNAPEAGWLHRDFTPTVQYDAAVGTVDASQPAPEAQVADQVSYWIAQGIRNAELTIAGTGSEPVQVSISMSGNEAQVDFRTEHAHTREMLNDSIGHLEELLQSQGMSLSGVSVGSSGAGASGGQNERARQGGGARSAAVSPVAAGAADTPTVRTPKGAVDLFV